MNALQRVAYWNLGVCLSAMALVVGAWPWLGFRALGFFGILGLLGFQVLFLRRAPLDERDRVIDSRARTFSFAMTFIVFWIAGMLMLFFFDENGSVPSKWIILAMWSLFAVVYLTHSVATLWQYRKDGLNGLPS